MRLFYSFRKGHQEQMMKIELPGFPINGATAGLRPNPAYFSIASGATTVFEIIAFDSHVLPLHNQLLTAVTIGVRTFRDIAQINVTQSFSMAYFPRSSKSFDRSSRMIKKPVVGMKTADMPGNIFVDTGQKFGYLA